MRHRGRVLTAPAAPRVCVCLCPFPARTQDLALCIHGASMKREHWLNTTAYLEKVEEYLARALRTAH